MISIVNAQITQLELQEIIDLCRFDEPLKRQAFSQDIVTALREVPHHVLFLKSVEGHELNGFMIVENTPWSSVHIAQTWVSSKAPMTLLDEMFSRVILWAVTCGKHRITAESTRNPDVINRRLGFTVESYNLTYVVPQDILETLTSSIKEALNGKSLSQSKTKLSECPVVPAADTPRPS